MAPILVLIRSATPARSHLSRRSDERPRRAEYRPPSCHKAPAIANAMAASGLLLVLDVTDDVGHVVLGFLGLLDEGGIVQALVDLDVLVLPLGALDRRRSLAARALDIGLLEGNEFGLGRFGDDGLLGRHRRPRGFMPGARYGRRRRLEHGAAFRANDRVLAEVVKLCAAIAAGALGAKLGFSHGQSLSVREIECFTWPVAPALSIAPPDRSAC